MNWISRTVAIVLLAVTLVGTTPAKVDAGPQCTYWLQQYLWYSMRFNEWMTYYQQSGDDFYYWIAYEYYQQMQNASEGIDNACPDM